MWVLYVLWAVLGMGLIGWGGLFLALIGEFAGPEQTGTATGFVTCIILIGSITGPPLFGFIVDATGSYKLAWLFLSICVLISTILLFSVREERRVV